MGHLVNPLSYRLYTIRYWNQVWFAQNNYPALLNENILLDLFFRRMFYIGLRLDKVGILFSHIKMLRSFSSTRFYLFIHDSYLDVLLYEINRLWKIRDIRENYNRRFIKRLFLGLEFVKLNKSDEAKFLKYLKKTYSFRLHFFISKYIKFKFLKQYWTIIKQLFFLNLKKIGIINYSKLFIVGLSKWNVNASIIAEFFYIRLKQYYTIWEILRTINYLFKLLRFKYRIIKGYRIVFSGRFTRKQRSTYSWRTVGSISPSTVKSNLDYCHTSVVLKYSICTVKVWVRLKKGWSSKIDYIL